jgi:hypothetical protein
MSKRRPRLVIQAVNPTRYAKEVVDELGVPQRTIVACSEEFDAPISEGQLSLFLAGKRGASVPVQDMLLAVSRFARKEVRSSRIPIDFSNIPAIRALFREFLDAENEDNVIRSARESRLDGGRPDEENNRAGTDGPAASAGGDAA